MARRKKIIHKNKNRNVFFPYIIISLIILLSITKNVSGAEWTQYSPSPVSSSITMLKTIGTYALAITTAQNVIYYNGSEWQEINEPNNNANYTIVGIDRATDGKFYIIYFDNAGNDMIYSYTPSNVINCPTCWNSIQNDTNSYGQIACIHNGNGYNGNSADGECYILNDTGKGFISLGASPTLPPVTLATNPQDIKLVSGRKTIWIGDFWSFNFGAMNILEVYYYNGVSWQHKLNDNSATGFPPPQGTLANAYDISSSQKALVYTGNGLADLEWYNSSSGVFYDSGISSAVQSGFNDNKIYYIPTTDQTHIYKISMYGNTTSNVLTASSNLQTIDIDDISHNGWAGGDNGLLYSFGGTITTGITQNATPNPTTYGATTNWTATPTHALGYQSNVTLTISGACLPITLTYDFFNINSGDTVSYDFNSTQFTQNTNCTMHTVAHFTNGDIETATDINLQITQGTPTFTLIPRISPQPTNYGNQVIFYAKPTYSGGVNSNVTLEIWDTNLSTLYYTTTVNNVPNGAETEIFRLNLNDIRWTNYQAGNYIYNIQATLINNNATLSNSTAWTVTAGATTNVTNYKATCYNKLPDDTGFNGIYSLTAYDEDNVYSSIKNGSNIYIASWDTTNPSDILYSRLNTGLNQQSGRNGNPNSISGIDMLGGADTLYIGTNDDLFLYTNASNRKAENLVYSFDKGFGILQNDGIGDVSAKDNDYAYVCQDGVGLVDDDDIYLYNKTLADFQDQMNNNPCISIKYDGWVYAHRGYNYDVKIWNALNQTNVATIDFTKTISTRAYNDLLDVNSNYLSFIAGKDEIRRYDVTNHSNPVLSGKCFTNQTNEEIESIEAINDNEIIIGVYNPTDNVDILYACDFGNNETYSTSKGGYVAQYLSGLSGDRAWEIIKNNNQGKISIATGNMYETCFYEKTNESITTNNKPIIDDYTFTPSQTICLNQAVDIEIIAHDPDISDTLSYGVSCSGGGQPTSWSAYNLLTCTYPTSGTKTVTIMVKDNWGLPSNATYDTIQVNNCNQSTITTLFFKIIDGNTAQPINGVITSVYNNQTLVAQTTTNNNGYADFTGLNPNILYRTTFTMDNYAPKTEYFYTSNSRYTRALDPTGTNGTTRTILIVTVTNSTGSPLETALVSTLDPTTGSSKYGLTDYSGTVYLFDVMASNSFIVGAKKDGYETTSVYASIGNGEQKTVNIIMGQSRTQGGYFPATPRHCADTIKGVWLCGNLSVTGIGDTCTQDSDCISGRCSLGLSVRDCARFNYTLCDTQGINRGNTCIFRNMTRGILSTIGDMILGNFLYVLLLVFLIVAGLIIKRSLSNR